MPRPRVIAIPPPGRAQAYALGCCAQPALAGKVKREPPVGAAEAAPPRLRAQSLAQVTTTLAAGLPTPPAQLAVRGGVI